MVGAKPGSRKWNTSDNRAQGLHPQRRVVTAFWVLLVLLVLDLQCRCQEKLQRRRDN